MFGQIYNNQALRKYVIYFGNLFNNIYLQRDNSEDEVVQTMKVPLNYGPKEKFLARLEGNPGLDRNIAITLPRMSFEIINIQYDSERKTNSLGRITTPDPDDPSKAAFQWNPVPYNIEFSLYVMVKNAEDGTRIIEQILPFFTPEWTATLNLNEATGAKFDIPLSLSSVSQQDTYEGDFQTRRAIIWTLNFTMRAYIFGPTRLRKVITQAEVNTRVPPLNISISDSNSNNSLPASELAVSPGQDLSGNAVNYYGPESNRPINILNRNEVDPNEEYGFIVDFRGE